METTALKLDITVESKQGRIHTFVGYNNIGPKKWYQVITMLNGIVVNDIDARDMDDLVGQFMKEVNRIGEYNV